VNATTPTTIPEVILDQTISTPQVVNVPSDDAENKEYNTFIDNADVNLFNINTKGGNEKLKYRGGSKGIFNSLTVFLSNQ
jgi:hypothetical protein